MNLLHHTNHTVSYNHGHADLGSVPGAVAEAFPEARVREPPAVAAARPLVHDQDERAEGDYAQQAQHAPRQLRLEGVRELFHLRCWGLSSG